MAKFHFKDALDAMRSSAHDILISTQWFLLLHSKRFYLFDHRGDCVSIFAPAQSLSSDDICIHLDELLKKAAQELHYAGQPLKILLGGFYCFFWIDEGSKSISEISKFILGNNSSKSAITLRFLSAKNGRKYAFLSGCKENIGIALYNFLSEKGILSEDCLPISFLVYKGWSQGKLPDSADFDFLGLSFNMRILQGIPNILESSSLLKCNDDNSISVDSSKSRNKKNARNSSILWNMLKPPFFKLSIEKPFYNIDGARNRDVRRYLLFLSSIKLLGRTALTLAILSLLIVSIGNLTQSASDLQIQALESQYSRKLNLENTHDSLSAAIREFGSIDNYSRFAPHISAFCQSRPSGLILTLLNIMPDERKRLALIAEGKSLREDAVFEYQRMVSEHLCGPTAEITQLKSTNLPAVIPGQQPIKSFMFRMQMSLDDD
jgi:hypothetical protein